MGLYDLMEICIIAAMVEEEAVVDIVVLAEQQDRRDSDP